MYFVHFVNSFQFCSKEVIDIGFWNFQLSFFIQIGWTKWNQSYGLQRDKLQNARCHDAVSWRTNSFCVSWLVPVYVIIKFLKQVFIHVIETWNWNCLEYFLKGKIMSKFVSSVKWKLLNSNLSFFYNCYNLLVLNTCKVDDFRLVCIHTGYYFYCMYLYMQYIYVPIYAIYLCTYICNTFMYLYMQYIYVKLFFIYVL